MDTIPDLIPDLIDTATLKYYFRGENDDHMFNVGNIGDVLLAVDTPIEEIKTIEYKGRIVYSKLKNFPKIPLLLFAYGNLTIRTSPKIERVLCTVQMLPQQRRMELVAKIMDGQCFVDKENLVVYERGDIRRLFFDSPIDIQDV